MGISIRQGFGDENVQLDGVYIELNDLPKEWQGVNDYLFYEGSAEFGDLQIKSDHANIKKQPPRLHTDESRQNGSGRMASRSMGSTAQHTQPRKNSVPVQLEEENRFNDRS